jgi:TrmH family RNA methyltransferase
VEGPKLLGDALAAGLKPLKVAVAEEEALRHAGLLEQCGNAGADLIALPGRLLEGISDVVTCQGIVALAEPVRQGLGQLVLSDVPLLLVADGIQDPGNLGAMVRSAAAFGADALVTLPGCADPWGAKAIRGSAGTCFRLQTAAAGVDELFAFLKAEGIASLALDSGGEQSLEAGDLAGPCAIIVGSEGAGLSEGVRRAADALAAISIRAGVESLNAAVAAAIALHAAALQRAVK